MTNVKCNVNNCIHNDVSLCYASKINVNGKRSHTSTHTCCSSFLQRQDSLDLTNNVNSETECAFVGCNVKTCINNVGSTVCVLDEINVFSNTNTPNLSSETYCSSFRCK